MVSDYYILVNTNDDNLRYNVYTYTKGTTEDCDYYFFVLIGKIINPTAYTKDEVGNFLTKYDLSISPELTDHFEKGLKIFFLEIDKIKKIYYLNLNGGDDLYTHLNKPFDKARFIEQYINQKKILKKLKNDTCISKKGKGIEPLTIPLLASYYVGLN